MATIERTANPRATREIANPGPEPNLARRFFVVLAVAAVVYGLLAGLRTVMDFDLGWQLATGRWIVQHHQVPSSEVFSYTAAGQPWIYPVGAALFFYAAFLAGKYALLSWLGALACAGTVALLISQRSPISAALAILAVPIIALRTSPRAEMFTVLLFAAYLVVLWRYHEHGRARLWLLPLLMIGWVNLHPGFVGGVALLIGYVLVEVLEMIWPQRRQAAVDRLSAAWPWLLATVAATVVNPWKAGIYRALISQQSATAAHSKWIAEWSPTHLNWTLISTGFSLRDPEGALYVVLLAAAVAFVLSIWQRKLGAAMLLGAATALALLHIRFHVIFAEVTVVIGGAIFTSALARGWSKIRARRIGSIAATCLIYALIGLACLRSVDLASNRPYLGTSLSSFGAGPSWWFPQGAAAWVERENLPARLFNTYNEGGYLTWRLGPKYQDYIDGRALPFGAGLLERNQKLLTTPPESPDWQREADRYGLNTLIVPLGRYFGLELFPVLPQFCSSSKWRPVYLDEVSAVFLRNTPENGALIQRLQVDCSTAPLPSTAPQSRDSSAFNQWANAAAVLHALGRNNEAFAATASALDIYADSAFIHFLRGQLLEQNGNLGPAEQEFLRSAALEVNGSIWSDLARLYHRESRRKEEIQAWERACDLLARPDRELLSLGFARLEDQHPRQALQTFDRAAWLLEGSGDKSLLASLAHGRALAWKQLGDYSRAISFQEQTVQLAPSRSPDWWDLADLYEHEHRVDDAQRARWHAAASSAQPPTGSLQAPE